MVIPLRLRNELHQGGHTLLILTEEYQACFHSASRLCYLKLETDSVIRQLHPKKGLFGCSPKSFIYLGKLAAKMNTHLKIAEVGKPNT